MNMNTNKNEMWALETFNGPLAIKNVPKPKCGPNEILATPKIISVCGGDMKRLLGMKSGNLNYPICEFHEAVGQIVEVGENVDRSQFNIGDRIVSVVRRCFQYDIDKNTGNLNFKKCYNSSMCKNYGRADECSQGCYISRGTGKVSGFGSEYYIDHVDNIVKISDSQWKRLGDATTLAEPMSVAWKLVEQIQLTRKIDDFSNKVLVIGLGCIGLLTLSILRFMFPGLHLDAADIIDSENRKIELLEKYNFNINYHQIAQNGNWPDSLNQSSYDIIIDCTGLLNNLYLSVSKVIKPQGVIALIGLNGSKNGTSIIGTDFFDKIVTNNLKIIGSACANKKHIIDSLRFMEGLCPKGFLNDMIYPSPLNQYTIVNELADIYKLGDYIKLVIKPV